MLQVPWWSLYLEDGKYIQNLDKDHLSSKPQHRWAEDGKEHNELWQMIINDVSQKYNHKPHNTDKHATWVSVPYDYKRRWSDI